MFAKIISGLGLAGILGMAAIHAAPAGSQASQQDAVNQSAPQQRQYEDEQTGQADDQQVGNDQQSRRACYEERTDRQRPVFMLQPIYLLQGFSHSESHAGSGFGHGFGGHHGHGRR
jgi:hypothetical protein